MEKCEYTMEAMRKCCDKFGERSTCCSGFLKERQQKPKWGKSKSAI